MYTLVGLAEFRLPIPASHDRALLTDCVFLRASPGVIGCIESLDFARWKRVGGRDAIACALGNRMVIFEVWLAYLGRVGGGDRRGIRTDSEVFGASVLYRKNPPYEARNAYGAACGGIRNKFPQKEIRLCPYSYER